MSRPRDTRSQSPHGVAFLAALLVLGAGFGVGTYFIELRGIGLSAMLAGDLAPELVILAGAVLAMAVVVQLHVARAARQANPTRALRSMLRQALTCLQASEDEQFEALQGLPGEMHDFIGMVTAEKSRTEEARHEVQSMRREMNDLLQGLDRSATALEPLREDTKSEFVLRVARAWNRLLERMQSSRTMADAVASSGSLDLGSRTLTLSSTSPVPGDMQALANRVYELEASLERLRDEVRTAPPAPADDSAPGRSAIEPSVLSVPEIPAGESKPQLRFATRASMHHAVSQPQAEAEPAEMLARPQDLSLETFLDPSTVPPEVEEIPASRSEVAPPSTAASASGYHEWAGRSGFQGSWRLQDEAEDELQADTEAGAESEFATPPPFTAQKSSMFVDDTYESAAAAPPAEFERSEVPPPIPAETGASDPGLEIQAEPEFRFPHFVGKPGAGAEGRIAVTFEGTPRPGAPESDPGDASANPQAGRSLIVDLRTLGAVELEE